MTAICLCRNCYDRGNVKLPSTHWACQYCELVQSVADTVLYVWRG